jgi:phosphoglycerol transferase
MDISLATSPWSFKQAGARLMRNGTYLLALFLFCLSYWLHRSFGQPDLNQILYHLRFGVELASTSDPVFTERFVKWCLFAPLVLLAVLLYCGARVRHAITRTPHKVRSPLAFIQGKFPQILILGAMVFWLCDVNALQYTTANFGPDYFGSHYVPPGAAQVIEKAPKNLVLIYVESLEMGYSSRAAFGRDMLAPLTALHGTSFAHYEQAPGTGWTIAALVATQCGVPLERVTVFDLNTQGQMIDSFLNKAVCLPDLLAEHGYRNVFMGGAATSFAGKDKFLAQHHYDEVYGKDEWLQDGVAASGMNAWGLYDGDLFSRALTKLRTLSASPQKFNLTLLTVDTHEPDGHLSHRCAQAGYAGFDGVIACTAREVAEFVRIARQEGLLEGTNVVIIGDHLARKNPLTEQLSQLPQRTIYNSFISDDAPAPNRTTLLHFDLMPTILEFAGFSIPDGRLGLGYSAFNQHPSQPPRGRLREMEKDLLNSSAEYLELWQKSEGLPASASAPGPVAALSPAPSDVR